MNKKKEDKKQDDQTAWCVPKVPHDTFVGLGMQIASDKKEEITAFLKEKKGTVEADRLEKTNLLFAIPIVVRDQHDVEEAKKDQNAVGTSLTMTDVYPQNYSIPLLEHRLAETTFDPARCSIELCIPEVCTFLDMNFAGEVLLHTDPLESENAGNFEPTPMCTGPTMSTTSITLTTATHTTTTAVGSTVTVTTTASGTTSFYTDETGCIPKGFSYGMNKVNVETYCNPQFGTRLKTAAGEYPLTENSYEKKFPTNRPVPSRYNAYEHAGVLVPIKKSIFNPTHYYDAGEDGRYGDGQLKTEANPCNKRLLPRYMFGNICAHHVVGHVWGKNCIGTKRKPKPSITYVDDTDQSTQSKKDGKKFKSHEEKPEYANVLFTLNDPLIMIGPFAGYAAVRTTVNNPSITKEYRKYGYFMPFVINRYDNPIGRALGLNGQITAMGSEFATKPVLTLVGQYYQKSQPYANYRRTHQCQDLWVNPASVTQTAALAALMKIPYKYKDRCVQKRFSKLDDRWQWYLKYSTTYWYTRDLLYQSSSWDLHSHPQAPLAPTPAPPGPEPPYKGPVAWKTAESQANSLVLNQMWSIAGTTLGGYLNDVNAWATPPEETGPFQFPYKIDPTFDAELKKTTFKGCLQPDEGNSCFYDAYRDQLDWPEDLYGGVRDDNFNAQRKSTKAQLTPEDITNPLKQPLQTIDPKQFKAEDASNVPEYLRGKNFATFIQAQFSMSAMVDQIGRDITYYHPMFRPIVFEAGANPNPEPDKGCYYDHTEAKSAASAENNPGFQIDEGNYTFQSTKGYCYCDAADHPALTHSFVASTVSLIRAFHLRVKIYDEDCKTKPLTGNFNPNANPNDPDYAHCDEDPPTFCKTHSLNPNDPCEVPDETKKVACAFHNPVIVGDVLNNRDVHIQQYGDKLGSFKQPEVDVASDALCDLQTCDVVMNGDHTMGDYICAQHNVAILRQTVWHDGMFDMRRGEQPDAKYANQGWYGKKKSFFAENGNGYVDRWYRVSTVRARDKAGYYIDDNNEKDPYYGFYCYQNDGNCNTYGGGGDGRPWNNWMLIQRDQQKHNDPPMVNYYEAIEYNAKAIAVFPASDMDAGFSNDKSTREAITCDCDDQEIELKCTGEAPPAIVQFYEDYKTDEQLLHLTVAACAYSFANSPHGPDIGLFLPSTSRNVRVIERNMLHFDGDSLNDRYKHLQKVVLGEQAPSPEDAKNLIFNETQLDGSAPDYTEVKATTFRYSCMRYPYGRLHRSQMSKKARDKIYPNQDQNVDYFTYQSLVGYCEFVHTPDGHPRLRHCPNARHTPVERLAFCTDSHTSFMATNIIYGLHVLDITRETSCSDTYKICLIIPGSPDTAGSIKSYTEKDRPGLDYTLLVAPFNASLISRYMLNPQAMPTIADRHNPFVMTNYTDRTYLKTIQDHNMKETFGYVPKDVEDMLTLAAGVERYLTTNNFAESPESRIASVVTGFVDTLKGYAKEFKCPESKSFIVPEVGSQTLKECVAEEDILLPLDEILIPVEHDGMTIKSAYQPKDETFFPVKFKGVPDRASSCNRFVVGGSRFVLHASFDQSRCHELQFDNYHMVPLKMVGVKLDESKVAIDTSATSLPLSVAVLGSDAELFNVPAVLKMSNFEASIISHNESDFDLAFARVSPVGDEAEVTVHCITPQTKTAAHCRVLLMGIKEDELVIRYKKDDGWPNIGETDSFGLCTYGPPAAITEPDMCRVTDVSHYTGVFGYGYEKVVFSQTYARHHIPTMNVLSVIMCILLAGLVCINIALWVHDDSEVRHAAGLQPHRVSFAELSQVAGVECKGTKVHVGEMVYTVPELEKEVGAHPETFSRELVSLFT